MVGGMVGVFRVHKSLGVVAVGAHSEYIACREFVMFEDERQKLSQPK
jgi:hypothetical protein